VDSATLVFLVIGGIGVLVLAVSLLGGEFLHFGGVDGGGAWSVEAISGFAGAFGFVGAIVNELLAGVTSAAPVLAVTAGIAAALPMAYLALRLSKAARNMRTDATPTRSDLVGSLGVVVTSIPAQGYGEVRIRLGGQPVKLNARADQPIPMGAHVFVVEAPSDTSVVVEETAPLH
jgi:membrane protein implicated in regulation of membrane protease activity